MKFKIIDFLLIFLIVFLIMSMFTQPKEEVKKISNTIKILVKDNYTIPMSLKVDIQNDTSKDFIFNTCENLKIKLEWSMTPLSFDNCRNVIIKSWITNHIDYTKYFNDFKDLWKYSITLKKWDFETISQFKLESKWFFSKLFTYLFYAPIYNLMSWLLYITSYSLWWSIVIITIILRAVLLIPQHKMMVSQRKMRLIQPKIKEIQEKYKWNSQMLWMELMKLYKEEKINPMWSCWLLLIQMPILIVIYYVILEIQNTVNSYYLYSFLSDFDVSKIVSNFYWIDLYAMGWLVWLILALIVWIVQFIQIKLSLNYNKVEVKKTWIVLEKKSWKDWYNSMMPDPEMLNKFMLYVMPIMIAIATFTLHAWLGIYFLVWTLFMIFQQLFVNKLLKK